MQKICCLDDLAHDLVERRARKLSRRALLVSVAIAHRPLADTGSRPRRCRKSSSTWAHRRPMSCHMLLPERVFDLSIVDRPDIKQRQLGFAAKLLAGEDGGTSRHVGCAHKCAQVLRLEGLNAYLSLGCRCPCGRHKTDV